VVCSEADADALQLLIAEPTWRIGRLVHGAPGRVVHLR
jgi:hypothetical protein